MDRRRFLQTVVATGGALAAPTVLRQAAAATESPFRVRYYPVAAGMGSRDVTAAPDGSIWFCGQRNGMLGRLDPRDGTYKLINLGPGAAPHGVVVGPDGAPWITEGGQNAIARVDPADHAVKLFKLPASQPYANLNTGVFDKAGIYWFTGQSGIYGRLDPQVGRHHGVRGAARPWSVWHHRHAQGRRLVRLAGRQSYRQDRSCERQGDRRGAADAEARARVACGPIPRAASG